MGKALSSLAAGLAAGTAVGKALGLGKKKNPGDDITASIKASGSEGSAPNDDEIEANRTAPGMSDTAYMANGGLVGSHGDYCYGKRRK